MNGHGLFRKRDEWASVQLELHVAAKLDLLHCTHVGTVLDLCSSGATVNFSTLPKIGSTGYLAFADLSLYCTVAWAEVDRCGILFDRHLPDRQMEALAWISRNHDAYERSLLRDEGRTWR